MQPGAFTTRLAAIGALCLFATATDSRANRPTVSLRVSPIVALEPAVLTVRASIEPNDDARRLRVVVSSGEYLRSSEIPLEGRSAPRTSVIELKGVPAGLYEVRATVLGVAGPIGTAMQLAKVQGVPGQSH